MQDNIHRLKVVGGRDTISCIVITGVSVDDRLPGYHIWWMNGGGS